jgi:hypothetical protein
MRRGSAAQPGQKRHRGIEYFKCRGSMSIYN